MIAISFSEYRDCGCPDCGFLPEVVLSKGWTLTCSEGDIGSCPKCRMTFVVMPGYYVEAGPNRYFSMEIAIGKNGKASSPVLQPHPRQGIHGNHDFDGQIDLNDLPGTEELTPSEERMNFLNLQTAV